jgi:hypothetical protein
MQGVLKTAYNNLHGPTYFSVDQQYYPSNGFINGLTSTTASYWSIGEYLTGSNTTSVLTASNGLYNIYQAGNLQQVTPTASIDNLGFSSINTLFNNIQVGDRIRFMYDETRLHTITNVTVNPSNGTQSGSLFLTVVPAVATSSILDNFELYRIVNDGTYVVLNVKKPLVGNSFTGIIQPQYISQTLKDNYNNIIQDLTQKGIIS